MSAVMVTNFLSLMALARSSSCLFYTCSHLDGGRTNGGGLLHHGLPSSEGPKDPLSLSLIVLSLSAVSVSSAARALLIF